MKDQAGGALRTRRQHGREFKDDLIAQSLVPGASVSAIAMKGGINANLLFKWRRDRLKATVPAVSAASTLLPVCVIPDVDPSSSPQPAALATSATHRAARSGVIEVEISGALVRLRGTVDEAALGSVVRVLRETA